MRHSHCFPCPSGICGEAHVGPLQTVSLLATKLHLGSVGAALGYTMQATISSWLMATLTTSALMVALVQTASTAPMLLFGLIAGSLSDIVDRRRVILITQVTMLTTVAILGVAAIIGIVGPVSLLVLTLFVGCGFTFYIPAQQASINELVTQAELPRAVALGAVAFNVARAAGPALAGAIVAWFGSGSAFLASAFFFMMMIAAARRWKRSDRPLPGVPERLFSGVRSGLRYAWHSSAMRALIVRSLSFSLCASAFWALLPLIARDLLDLGAGGFGLLSAAFGAGAIVGAWSIPHQLKRFPLNNVVTYGVLMWTVAVALIVATKFTTIAVISACGAGTAWVCVLAGLSAGTQSTAPAWVRARAVSMYLVATQGSLALGSAVWGMFASVAGIRFALVTSVAGGHGAASAGARYRDRHRAVVRRWAGPDSTRIPDRATQSQGISARHAIGGADAASQRRDELARLSRYRRQRALRRTVRHRVVGRLPSPTGADDDRRPRAAGQGRTVSTQRRSNSHLPPDRRRCERRPSGRDERQLDMK